MTQEAFTWWMASEDKRMRGSDWDYYLNRGMMELLMPLLKAQMGPEMADYIQAMEDYIQLRNWTIYEAGRRLGEAVVAGEAAVDREAAEALLERITVDPPVPEELTALRDRVRGREQGVYFPLYQQAASEVWKFQGVHAGLRGVGDGGVDMEWLKETFGRQEEETGKP